MAKLDRKHFQQAMLAVERLDVATTGNEIAGILERSVSAFGMEYFSCLMPKAHRSQTFDACVLMNGWPSGWFDLYRHSDFHRDDPIVKHTRSSFRSFFWSEAPIPDDVVAQNIMTIAEVDFRMRDGVSIPIHSVDGYQAGISFSGYDIEKTADAKAALELIAIYAFNKFAHLRVAAAEHQKCLTARQREVLSWTAVGKTAWDIGQILGISEDTVNKMVGSAIVRLSAANRTHAVVEAIRRKEIDL